MTLDPANGDRSKITIDSSYGVGEMVVSGQVTPDNIVLDKVTLAVVCRTPRRQARRTRPGRRGPHAWWSGRSTPNAAPAAA